MPGKKKSSSGAILPKPTTLNIYITIALYCLCYVQNGEKEKQREEKRSWEKHGLDWIDLGCHCLVPLLVPRLVVGLQSEAKQSVCIVLFSKLN